MIKEKKRRFLEIDLLRGLCVILMIFDHFMYFAGNVFPFLTKQFNVEFWARLPDFAVYYWYHNARAMVRYVVVGLFMVLCGISCTLTKSNLKRGLKACACALVITVVTRVLTSILGMDVTIRFGVIHMLAAAMLLYALFQAPSKAAKPLLENLSKNHKSAATAVQMLLRLLPALVGIATLVVYFGTKSGQFVMRDNNSDSKYLDLISNVTANGTDGFKDFVSIFVELKNYYFISADYFPLLPYAALVLAGGAVGELLYKKRVAKPVALTPAPFRPITFVGRHALVVYLAHQVVVAGFFVLAVLFASI